MPIYEYKCEQGHVFDTLQKMSDDPLTSCIECGAPVKKLMQPVNISFKGSGFYSTDYSSAKAGSSGSSESSGNGDSSGSSSSSDTSNSSDSSKSSNGSSGKSSGEGSKAAGSSGTSGASKSE